MIHKTFDNRTPAIISPENYRSGKRFADTCILTFSCEVRDNALEQFPAQKVGALNSVNGPVPIYVMPYKGRNVAFFMCPITAPVAAMGLEEASQLLGATNFIMFGSCGVLDSDIAQGKLIVPTHAYRDEGVSYHYRRQTRPTSPSPPAILSRKPLKKWACRMYRAARGRRTPSTAKHAATWKPAAPRAASRWKWNAQRCRPCVISGGTSITPS